MIVKSLIHFWDNFEQNAKMLTHPLLINTRPWINDDLAGTRNLIKMSSVMPFTFNAVKLCVVTINEKPWTRAKEVFKALKHDKKLLIS